MTSLSKTLIKQYQSGNDVIRCAAVGALEALKNDDEPAKIRKCLLSAIRDEDPDVRVDAMSALKHWAEPQDTDLVRESLIEDPVRDVKVSAIEILTNLADTKSIPLFMQLAEARNEEEFAWEDETDVWDDWLDVQIASIFALSKLQVDDAIPLLLALRDDEFGQELDSHLLPALARMSSNGLAAVIELGRDPEPKTRTAALLALKTCDPELFRTLTPSLIDDELAEFRLLAVPHIDPLSETASFLALKDPDPVVRHAAVTQFGPNNQSIVQAALADEAELVGARALELLELPISDRLSDALINNGLIWLKRASTPLAVATATIFPKIAGSGAVAPLAEVLEDEERDLEIRIAAAKALISARRVETLDVLSANLENPSQQIRIVALAGITDIAADSGEIAMQAVDLLVDVISHKRQIPVQEKHPDAEAGMSLEAPKTEGEGRRTIRISEDGEIIDTAETSTNFSSSTLGNIEFSLPEQEQTAESNREQADASDEGDGVRGHRKKRRRVAVEGPDDFSEDLCVRAIEITAQLDSEPISKAITKAATSQSEIVRAAAISRLANLVENNNMSKRIEQIMVAALKDENPIIRASGAEALKNSDKSTDTVLEHCLADEDTLVRAIAVEIAVRKDPDCAARYIADGAGAVRIAALKDLSWDENREVLLEGLRHCLSHGYRDTLIDACFSNPKAQQIIVDLLNENADQPQNCLVLMNAIAQADAKQTTLSLAA